MKPRGPKVRYPATDPRAAKALAVRDARRPNAARPTPEPRPIPLPVLYERPPCAREGAVLEFCPTCNKGAGERRHVRDCDVHGKCTRGPVSGKIKSCDTCDDYTHPLPDWSGDTLTLNETNLYPGLPGKRFNPGLIEWGGGHAICWRDGWKGSDLWAVRANADLQPVGRPVRLDVNHPEASYGREDPNLFTFRGRLHVAFVGVVGTGNRATRTNVLYARLRDDLRVEEVFAPRAPGVDPWRWQKNWQWFESGGELFATYSVGPEYAVLRVDGERTSWAARRPLSLPWVGGEVRGGATPVLRNGELYSFFHDRIDADKRVYRVGCYTFSPSAPFEVLRLTREPLIVADPSTNPGNYCHCIFPRGAVVIGDTWVLSCGAHDRFTELRRLSVGAVERALVPL